MSAPATVSPRVQAIVTQAKSLPEPDLLQLHAEIAQLAAAAMANDPTTRDVRAERAKRLEELLRPAAPDAQAERARIAAAALQKLPGKRP